MVVVILSAALALLGLRRIWGAIEGPRTSFYGSQWAQAWLGAFFLSGAGLLIAEALMGTRARIVIGTVFAAVTIFGLIRGVLVVRFVRRDRERA